MGKFFTMLWEYLSLFPAFLSIKLTALPKHNPDNYKNHNSS